MKIRKVLPSDAARLLEIYKPYVEQTSITFEYELPELEEFEERIRDISSRYPYLVLEEEKIWGYAYAHKAQERAAYGWNAELSIYLDSSIRGRGMGRRLYHALMEILKLQKVQNLYALITHPNERSEAVSYTHLDVYKRQVMGAAAKRKLSTGWHGRAHI